MNRNQLVQICGFLGLVLIGSGAILYAINSPNRSLTYAALGAGIFFFGIFLVFNISLIKSFTKRRASRYGANMVVMVILFTCILAIVQTLSTRHTARFDLTRNARFSLATQTTSLLKHLDQDVNIHAFYKKSAPDRMRSEDLFEQYAHKTSHLRYEFIDPDHKPRRAKDMGVISYGTTIVKCGEKKELLTEMTEEALTNAILKVTRDITKAVYFIQGHGEKDPMSKENTGYSIAREAIEREGYLVKTLSLFEEESIPEDAYIIIIAGPSKDLFNSELEKIKEYFSRGRNAIFMVDPQSYLSNLDQLISEYGISLEDDIIIDPFSRIFGGDYTIPVVTQYESHQITKGFNVATFFPLARSVTIDEDASPGIEVQYLARTGKSAWGEKDLEGFQDGKASRDNADVLPPVPIAAIASKKMPAAKGVLPAAEEPGASKIVVLGDSDFSCNSSFRVSGNADFFMNIINFLAEEKDLIAIRPKQSLGDRIFLTASQGRLVFLLCVVVLPLCIITFGSTLFVKRRRRG